MNRFGFGNWQAVRRDTTDEELSAQVGRGYEPFNDEERYHPQMPVD